MLAEVARHAGTVAHTARLTTDLLRSRDRLVSAREEERRQLLRELHDGVGPTLAAITLGLHASRRAIGESAPSAMLLAKLQDALNGASTEVRRLAHGLRPPALEKLGLRAAIEDYIGTIGHAPGLTISYDAPEAPCHAARGRRRRVPDRLRVADQRDTAREGKHVRGGPEGSH